MISSIKLSKKTGRKTPPCLTPHSSAMKFETAFPNAHRSNKYQTNIQEHIVKHWEQVFSLTLCKDHYDSSCQKLSLNAVDTN